MKSLRQLIVAILVVAGIGLSACSTMGSMVGNNGKINMGYGGYKKNPYAQHKKPKKPYYIRQQSMWAKALR
ncbi:hypothetical protein [Pontibacter arcticus]|uniref:Lipoprotein n=1 Tax=Pontibacter arcticus TaxID=2080288 RepID=A0A364RCZ5_9BACT|nr:hypothetical protein [Pontibacter arcticus]RAU82153.1 hypothetical protein DP923_10120 [Pontibacter arcticus]